MDINANENTKNYEVLLNAFKKNVGFSDHQIKSFNEFIKSRVQNIVKDINVIDLETPELAEFKIRLGDIRFTKPTIKEADGSVRMITPAECRIRDFTYASPIYVNMIPIINDVEQDSQEVKIGELPIMIKSEYCNLNGMSREELIKNKEDPDDPGGYFIVNGTERVIVMMEEIVSNRPVLEKKKDTETARINSESSMFVQRHLVERKNGFVTVSFANMRKLPIVVLMRVLGMETDKQIIETSATEPEEMQEVYFNIYESEAKNTEEAKEEIGKRIKMPQKEYRDKRINDLLDKYLLPHIGQTKKNRMEKALYLANVMKKIIKLGNGKLSEQDIDHYTNKRLRMVGDFMEILFRSVLLGKFGLVSRIKYSYQKLVKRGKMPSIASIVESEYLTKRIISHMATGQWIGGRTGVCQRLERTNFIRTMAHVRNVISPLSSSQEHFEARALHPTQWGRLCAEETPEGVNIGLRKYMATLAMVSVKLDTTVNDKIIKIVGSDEQGSSIFLNGSFIGYSSNPNKTLELVKNKRTSGKLPPMVNIAYDEDFDDIHINTDSGRMLRPLINVEDGVSKLTKEMIDDLINGKKSWDDLVNEGIISYIDAEEEDNSYIAINNDDIAKDHTHVEINPATMLGLSASLVPFPEYDRGDRVNFGAKMSGQALGIYSTNYLARTETKADILLYPQKPLINTVVGRHIGFDEHPQGQNIVIAIASMRGYNMEDGIIMNKASIERGFGRSIFFRNYGTEEMRYWGIEKDEIKIPDKSVSGYKTEESYANLAEDGLVNREIDVESGDVLIGKISPLRFFGPVESFMVETENRRETSETVRYGESGVVDNVILTENINGNKIVKVTLRNTRIPELGDKFASRHGQKGVVALIVPEEDMPVTKDGVIPDIIINPHAIPSRMTIGQLIEMLASKVSALSGVEIDGSAFNGVKESDLRKSLKNMGFKDTGKENMYDGITGKKYEAEIFITPCYYQKLHHMVANKIQSRARGPVTLLTKQPTAGRIKQGGLRLGEMEKDCIIAHGASLLLKERFSSDAYKYPICENCGLIAIEDKASGKRYCKICKKSSIKDVQMSHAFKLMLDELKCLGIYPKLKV